MNIGVVITVTLVFFAIIGVAVYMVLKTYRQTDVGAGDSSAVDSQSTHDFLPFKEINYDVIDLGGHEYRAIIECSSVNYALKTGVEQDAIEAAFQRFLNSLTFPITMFIQTRVMDNSKMLEELDKELTISVNEHPQMAEYAKQYFEDMRNLSERIGNNKQKKKYIIVPYNEANNLSDMTDDEKYNYSLSEIAIRVNSIIGGLHPVGIKGKRMDSFELIELIHSCYHKDNYGHIDNAINGQFLSMIVTGKNHEEHMTDDMKMDFILYQAQMSILSDVIKDDMSPFLKEEYEDIIERIGKLRDSVGSHYNH